MKELYDEKFGTSYMPECADEWLELVHDIAVGYDGCRSEESLKALIDEMVEYAGNARKCMKQGNLYPNVGSKQTTNIGKIRAMSDEELAEYLLSISTTECPFDWDCKASTCLECWNNWLQKSVKED
jgi:hypothetical protein